MDETVELQRKDYKKLLDDSRLLDALRAAGVDNWDGYDYAQELLEEWEKEND